MIGPKQRVRLTGHQQWSEPDCHDWRYAEGSIWGQGPGQCYVRRRGDEIEMAPAAIGQCMLGNYQPCELA